jgi:hypothetical protein
LFLSLGLSLVNALWDLSLQRLALVGLRVLTAVIIGSFGGMMGGVIGQALYGWTLRTIFLIFGWAITGLLIGASLGVFEIVDRYRREEETRGALRKLVNGVIGGTAGGILGGTLFVLLQGTWTFFFQDKPTQELWTPSATGFVVLGLCIGLLIGMAQVILKEAWLRIEIGRRAGRELLLTKPEVTIGRAESCDVGLFGDPGVERLHARILRQGQGFVLADAGTPGGTFLNDHRLTQVTPLRSGDAIRVGHCVLRFGERVKRTQKS